MKLRRISAAFCGITAVVLLVEFVSELVRGELLTIEAGHVGVRSAILLAVWLNAVVHVSWLAWRDEPDDERAVVPVSGNVIVVPDPENYHVGQRINNECFVVAVNNATGEVSWASSSQWCTKPHLPAAAKR